MSTSSSSKRASYLDVEIRGYFEESFRRSYRDLKETCEFGDIEGEALANYGDDYMCCSVLMICAKLRSKNPNLFSKIGSEDVAKRIVKNLSKSDMIPQVSIRNGCFLTFKLSWEWMSKRINTMLVDGIKTWAPKYVYKKVALFVPERAIDSIPHADALRGYFIQETLAHMFDYSGVGVSFDTLNFIPQVYETQILRANKEVGKHFLIERGFIKKRSGRMEEPPLFVAAKTEEPVSRKEIISRDLARLWLGVYELEADFIICVAPLRRAGYIERCLAAARDVQWLKNDEMACHCGYRTSSNEKEKLDCLLGEFFNYSKAPSLVELGKAVGYTTTTEAFFEFALKYAYLKNNRSAEFPLSIDELFDEEGNTFVYLLRTRALVHSIIKNPQRGTFKLTEAFVAKERELALHLVRFTDEVRDSCLSMMPHILCDYLWDLCKKFTSCYGNGKVRPVEDGLLLCRATSVVMEKCFDLLRINTTSYSGYLRRTPGTVNPFIPWPADVSDARLKNLNPRIELFSIFVSIYADVEEAYLCGDISLVDFNGLEHGWLKSDNKDLGNVKYFDRDWSNPLAIRNNSFIYLGNPSSRYPLSLASTIEIQTDLVVTSEKNGKHKGGCFELSYGKQEFEKSDFWQNEDKRTECGKMAFQSESGFLQIHYILLKDAMDATMELSFESTNSRSLKVRGRISAYYGRGVLDECKEAQKMFHHALIFNTDGMLVLPGKKLDLRKSVLAVPANGDLNLEASFKHGESGETIVTKKVTYSVVTNKGFEKWEMPVSVKGKRVGSFYLKLEWIKGPGIFS